MKDFIIACTAAAMYAAGIMAGTLTGEPAVMTGPALWWLG